LGHEDGLPQVGECMSDSAVPDGAKKPRIVVAEDEAIVARDICALLLRMGYEPVARAASAQEAIAMTEQWRPDLVLMDINLAGSNAVSQRGGHEAGMDGIGAAQVIRQRFLLPVIFLTAYSGGETLTRAKLAEPFGYVTKPFTEHDLHTAIELALYKHQVEAERWRSETKFRTLFNSSRDAVMLFDGEAFEDCNPATLVTFGCSSRAEFCTKHPADLSPPVQPDGQDSRGLANRHIERALAEGSLRFEWQHLRQDTAALFDAEVLLSALQLDGKPFVQAVVRDISARKRDEAALLAAKAEAERANLAKSLFLSNMSHELRTPMNAVLGFAQLLQGDQDLPLRGHQVEYVRQIVHGGELLMRLINDVLDLASIEAGHLSVRLQPVPIAALLQECLTMVAGTAAQRGVVLSVDSRLDPATAVFSDRTRLSQVLLNLLSNAIKYNREQGTVEVALAVGADARHLHMRVTDQGPGLSVEHQQRLFQAFERLGAVGGSVPGTGIGLALSKRLVLAMHGEIGVHSQLGRGCTFWLRLPLVTR
jgi:PAS domain S-box-containing protein